MVTPRSFKSSAVSLGSTLESTALSRNVGAYCSSPSFRNQSVISIVIAGVMSNEAEHGLAGYSKPILSGRPLDADAVARKVRLWTLSRPAHNCRECPG